MTDEEAIRQLVARNWRHMDDRRSSEWVGTFTPDGEIVALVTSGDEEIEQERATGRQQLMAMADNTRRFTAGCHVAVNLVIDVRGTLASAESDVIFILGRDTLDVQYLARCYDQLRKVEGSWLVSSRRIVIRSMVNALHDEQESRRYTG
jgi:hypothetical protein